MKPGEKQIVVEIPEEIHRDIKKRALFRNMKMKEWVLLAFTERILKEEKYNNIPENK